MVYIYIIIFAGFNSIMVHFTNVKPYNWPGWFIATLAVVCAATVVLAFREPRPLGQLKSYFKCKMSLSLQTGWKIQFIVSFNNNIIFQLFWYQKDTVSSMETFYTCVNQIQNIISLTYG